MKKFIIAILAVTILASLSIACVACDTPALSLSGDTEEIIVFTNAFFAPFEYYKGTKIVGVDVDIMNKVGEKLNKKVVFENKDFGTLINYVEEGKLCDCSAAGFTITEERLEKVNFSTTYFTSVQYVIFPKSSNVEVNTASDGKSCFYWGQIAGKKVGVQLDTTGNIYVEGEANGWDGEPDSGVIQDTNTTVTPYDDAQLAFSALKAKQIDCVVIDMLPAQYLIKNDTADYEAYPLYYKGENDADDTATQEDYGIAVNKNNKELLDAINEVLAELLAQEKDGKNGVEQLVMSHFGM